MDSEYQQSSSSGQTPDLVSLSNIVLVRSKFEAELFQSKIFPICGNLVVVSGDQYFPKDSVLRKRALQELRTNEKVAIIAFDPSLIKTFEIKSQRILCLDSVIMADFRSNKAYSSSKFGFNDKKIALLIDRFFEQWGRIERFVSVKNEYIDSVFYEPTNSADFASQLIYRDSRQISDFQIAEISHAQFKDLKNVWCEDWSSEPIFPPELDLSDFSLEGNSFSKTLYFEVKSGFDHCGVIVLLVLGPNSLYLASFKQKDHFDEPKLAWSLLVELLKFSFTGFEIFSERNLFLVEQLNSSKIEFKRIEEKFIYWKIN